MSSQTYCRRRRRRRRRLCYNPFIGSFEGLSFRKLFI